MKCPKCGYNSFEQYDTCVKCSQDLSGYKATHGLTSLVIPAAARSALAGDYKSRLFPEAKSSEPSRPGDEVFAFDLPWENEAAEKTAVPAAPAVDPFDFGDLDDSGLFGPAGASSPPSLAAAPESDDMFGDLLDLGSFGGEESTTAAAGKASADAAADTFDPSSFSWDDTPELEPKSGAGSLDDDFDALFGDLEAKK
jgi:hypothetical protein